jgi:signal transduction histidine kinase
MAANRSKNEFLLNMSHEIRTPLNVISGLSEMMLDRTKEQETREQLKNIHSNSIKVLSTINTILDLSALETGQFQLHPEFIPLTELTEDIRSIYGPIAGEKGVELDIEIKEGFPGLIHIDELRFRTILFNLVENSVEFTSEGSISLTFGYDDHAMNDKKNIYVTIEDTGTGPVIKPSSGPVSGETRVGTVAYKLEDLDLTLSLSEKLVKKMKGSISFQHTPGKGNRFALQIPGLLYKSK